MKSRYETEAATTRARYWATVLCFAIVTGGTVAAYGMALHFASPLMQCPAALCN